MPRPRIDSFVEAARIDTEHATVNGMPGSKVGGKEQGCQRDGDAKCAARPARRLTGHCGNHEEKGERQGEPPEPRGGRADIRQAHQPGAERKRGIAEEECGEGQRVNFEMGSGHSRPLSLASP